MRTYTQELGKVRITCEGKYDSNKDYDILSLVFDDYKASYISRQAVPAGTPLNNEEYWQPFSSLNEAIVLDYQEFQAEMLKKFADLQVALSKARLVVNNDDERLVLTIDQVAPGCEVYVLSTGLTWILDTIETSNNNKTWHLESEGRVDSTEASIIQENEEYNTADRAVNDANGDQIDITYIKINDAYKYIVQAASEVLSKLKLVLADGAVKWNNLSPELQQALTSGHITINNLPDGEDITVDDDNLLRLADRTTDYGLGYIKLRKHFIGNLNILEQAMFTQENTIYEIAYDFNLDAQTLTLPTNSHLLFTGGKLSNGVLNYNETNTIKSIVDYSYDPDGVLVKTNA